MIHEEKTTVKYHSKDWDILACSGWITWTVDDDGTAHMLRAWEVSDRGVRLRLATYG